MPLELDLQVASAAPDLPSEAQFRAWCELALRQRPESELTIRLVDEAEGRKALALVLAAYRSAAEGKPVVL